MYGAKGVRAIALLCWVSVQGCRGFGNHKSHQDPLTFKDSARSTYPAAGRRIHHRQFAPANRMLHEADFTDLRSSHTVAKSRDHRPQSQNLTRSGNYKFVPSPIGSIGVLGKLTTIFWTLCGAQLAIQFTFPPVGLRSKRLASLRPVADHSTHSSPLSAAPGQRELRSQLWVPSHRLTWKCTNLIPSFYKNLCTSMLVGGRVNAQESFMPRRSVGNIVFAEPKQAQDPSTSTTT